MSGVPTLSFVDVARRLAAASRAAGLVAPVFRTPPRRPGVPRSIRRLPGGPVVSVRVKARPFDDVVVDMVEGILVANRLAGDGALRVRTALLDAAYRERPPARVA
ncbi:MAG TPA: hypothetical protein VL856_16080 [Acidimicrobiia bacterium]|nr:hypothetical protein [Acidimicrobiia bacterium]